MMVYDDRIGTSPVGDASGLLLEVVLIIDVDWIAVGLLPGKLGVRVGEPY